MRNIAVAAGLAAPLVYLATVFVGGWLTPGYSHMDQPVSALFEVGAPFAVPVSLAFVVYNLLLIAFGTGLLLRGEGLRAAAAMILANGAFGLIIELFPMDAPGTPVSFAGATHMAIAAGLVVTCIAAMSLAALAWWRRGRHPALVPLTWTLLVLMMVGGAGAALAATAGWGFLGAFQRITIGAYLIWIFAVALVQWRAPGLESET